MSIIKNRVLISDLCKVLDKYLSKDDVADVYKAYMVAASAHDGQYRKSGEAYVFHPINVAMILADLGFDRDSIIAALLHDCIEDTEITYEEIQKDFGQDVAFIVEGVSKLTDLKFKSKKDQQAQNFRKLLLAMSNDMRVIIIKLADRLHNMRTISSMSREKQIAISQETIDIHAPIARRLGLNSIKIELENIAFETLNPHRSKVIKQHLKKQFGNFKKNISHVQSEIIQRLSDEGVNGALVEGRQKEPYSLYRKMKYKHLKLSEVFDLFAFRVIVKDVTECYRTLGIIHNLYKPLPGKFKDYIALPKANGYQSLHTVLFGPKKMFIEIQIRSKDMHFISEYGIAAHWHYKNSNKEQNVAVSNWLGSLLDIQEASGTSVDFIEDTKNDLYPSEVFVFTPDGDIIQLPFHSTALDFAYAVHTKIGSKAVGAIIDRKNADLNTELKSGQTIEIITHDNSKPKTSWLNFVSTPRARNSIKNQLKIDSGGELIQLGRYLLRNSLAYQNIDIDKIDKDLFDKSLKELSCINEDELFMKIGLSEVLVSVVINKLSNNMNSDISIKSINISKTSGKNISFAHCCFPIPGDDVVGVLTATKGFVLHRKTCSNFIKSKGKNEQYLDVNWTPDKDELFQVPICVNVANKRGTLASIANTLSKIGLNIESLNIDEKDNYIKALNFHISVPNSEILITATEELLKLESVESVERKFS